MFKVFNLAVFGFLWNLFGGQPASIADIPLISWQSEPIFALPTDPDPKVAAIVQDYLQTLSKQGLNLNQQAVLIETQWAELARHNQNTPASAASLTKIATTLAAVETWPLDHRFETRFHGTGEVRDGVLQGDLIIEGSGDPLFVWEEAIAVGNALNQLGIRQVKGNLIVTGNFAMNFKPDPLKAGTFFNEGVNSSQWSSEIKKAFQALPKGTKSPQVEILGTVRAENMPSGNARLLLRHQSLTLTELLRQMNIYSNNVMAEMLANLLGGADVVDEIATRVTQVAPEEIQLINGSGLGVENRLSPHAVLEMLMALERKLANQPIKVADLFPVGGRDTKGTMHWRAIPKGVVVKTGTLAKVSALAGVIPTKERGHVWFVIMNSGSDKVEGLRHQQDEVLQALDQHWQFLLWEMRGSISGTAFLGDPSRISKVF